MAELMLINPRKRRATKKRRTVKRRSTTAARRRVSTNMRRRRRNPARRGKMNIMGTVMPAATAASGALALDVVWGYAPIPENLKNGPLRHVVKAAGAIGLGMLAGMVVKKDTADRFATGALTVTIHSAMREMVAKAAPNVRLGDADEFDDMGYYGSGVDPDDLGAYIDGMDGDDDFIGANDMDDGVGAYIDGTDDLDI